MSVSIAPTNNGAAIMEEVIAKGDLKDLKPEQRARYYVEVCKSCGLNPLTKPFDYITLNGKLTLYATRTAADQLRRLNAVNVTVKDRAVINDVLVVTVEASDRAGRTDSDIGAVAIGGLKGDAYANAIMKAVTKAKRRVTLSICGLGWLDETEVETIPSARPVAVDLQTGEIIDAEPASWAAEPAPATIVSPALPAESESKPTPKRANRYAALHAAIRDAALKNGSGVETRVVHEMAHDLACASLNVNSLTDISDEAMADLTDRIGRQDAAGLQASHDWAKKVLNKREEDRKAQEAREQDAHAGGELFDVDELPERHADYRWR